MPDQRVTASSVGLRSAVPVTPDSAGRWLLPLLGGLSILAVLPIWQGSHLPLQDLGLHLVKVDLLLRYLSGDPTTRALYQINWAPFPDWTCFAVLTMLAPFAGIEAAARLYVSACVLALPLAAYVWVKRTNPQGLLLVLAVPAISHNLFLAKGNLNFYTGLVLYLLALTAWEGRRGWLFAALATALYFTHGIVFFALLGIIVMRLIVEPQAVQLRRAAGLIPGLLCFITALLLNPATASQRTVPWPLLEVPQLNDMLIAIPWLLGPAVPNAVALLWGMALGGCVWAGLRPAPASAQRNWFWFAAALGFGGAFLFCTTQIGDWSHFRQRFLPFGLFAVLGFARVPEQPMVRALLTLLLVVTAVVAVFAASQLYRRGNLLIDEYLQAAAVTEPNAALLPLDFPNDTDWVRPAVHAWGLHQLSQPSLWTPYLDLAMVAQARMIYPILYRIQPWAPAQSDPQLDPATVRRIGACYDFVLIWEATPASAAALEPYYERVRQSSHAQVWRNRQGVRGGRPDRVAACRADTPA